MVSRKVVGTAEGLHYSGEIWKAMSKEQKAKVAELSKAKHAMEAASSVTAGPITMDVSNQLQMLTCAVKSLDSSRDSGHRSVCSQSWSSSHSHGSHQSGVHARCRKQ